MTTKNYPSRNPSSSDTAEENFSILGFGRMHGTDQLYVNIRFKVPSLGKNIDKFISLTDLKSQALELHIPDGFVLDGVRFKDQAEFIRMKVNEELGSFQTKMTTLLPQGFSCIDDEWVYVFGNSIMNADPYKYVAVSTEKIRLQDFYVSNTNAFVDWCQRFCKQGSAQAALFLCSLIPYLRPILEPLGYPELTVNSFLEGPTGCGKTSWAKLVATDWFGKTTGVNLGTDANAFFKEIAEYTDCTVLVDDLATSDSDSELEKRMRKFSELMQMNSAGGLIRAKGKDFDLNRVALIFTGEYLPNAASKLNRCLLLKMENKELPVGNLTYLQQNQYLYRSCLLTFIYWVCTRSDELRVLVKEADEQNSFLFKGNHAAPSQYFGFGRVMSSCKLLMIAAYLFIEFLKDRHVFEHAEKEYMKLSKHLSEAVNKAVADTLESIQKVSESNRVLDALIEIFSFDNDGVVADSIDQFVKKEKSIFFIHDNRIYVRNETLRDYLNDKFNCEVSSKSLSQELEKAHLFFGYGKDRSGDIPKTYLRGYKKNPKVKGRHYALSKRAISDLVLSKQERWLLGNSPIKSLRPVGYQ